MACWQPLVMGFWLAGCGEQKKDLSPPPLNPHPKEAVHIRVEFDNPEDGKNFTVTMKPLYQNQQRECGYIANWWVGNFVYPQGQFDIPNESREPGYADFTIYLDRYNRETCNWEFVDPAIDIVNKSTGWYASPDFGPRDMIPGAEFKTVCDFVDSAPNMCRHDDPTDFPWTLRVPITILVSRNSVPWRPPQPGFFSRDNFLKPMNPKDLPSDDSQNSGH